MIELTSTLEGKTFPLHELERKLKPLGYAIGGGWEYDHGFFDYKMSSEEGYQFLRLPFRAVEGQLDSPGVVVQLGSPFVLAHIYQRGIDEFASPGNIGGSLNQFAAPEDPDGQVPDRYVITAKRLLEEAENVINA
ncbi:YugN-like family protein [Bacillus thermotolerans]|uniref:YugN-like family protein n=1 Tax=Bacillus thermotolerans TaxID=1221996 RepID=A0A0F5I9Y4_BACTR|nr:YugN-like family protein [Bacillus thermotolerans]KKB40572.1 hypothetical protein QY96_02308 [Bacillus thermotolerans]KKB41992.1 hypothetical protein QY95_00415 [Bacillus thermotolerans]